MARVKLRGFGAIDRRTAGARLALAFKSDLVAALGGEADLSPQRRKLVDMAARAALLLDHVDAWLVEQRSLVIARSRTLVPIVTQRTQLADHLARLLDKLGLDRVPQKIPTLAEYVSACVADDGEKRPAAPVQQAPLSRRVPRTAVTTDNDATSEASEQGQTS